jgi:hypothetical protein
VWLTTSNDNTPALRFFQWYGLDLVAIRRDAIQPARQAKSVIPEIGLELEVLLGSGLPS